VQIKARPSGQSSVNKGGAEGLRRRKSDARIPEKAEDGMIHIEGDSLFSELKLPIIRRLIPVL
jgi:hypothetical protein